MRRRAAALWLALALAAACGRYGPPRREPPEPREPEAAAEPAPATGDAPAAPEGGR
jgi:hypothetical protein